MKLFLEPITIRDTFPDKKFHGMMATIIAYNKEYKQYIIAFNKKVEGKSFSTGYPTELGLDGLPSKPVFFGISRKHITVYR